VSLACDAAFFLDAVLTTNDDIGRHSDDIGGAIRTTSAADSDDIFARFDDK
jgi:hypothetical protein